MYLNIHDDDDAEEERFVIMGASAAVGQPTEAAGILAGKIRKDVAVKIEDDETQLYTLLVKDFGTDNTIKEGETLELELEADPPRTIDVTLEVSLESVEDDSDYGLGAARSTRDDFVILSAPDQDSPPGIVSVMLFSETPDIDRVDDTVTLTTKYADGGDERAGGGGGSRDHGGGPAQAAFDCDRWRDHRG